MSRKIQLSETEFKNLIKESVKQIIKEYTVTMSNKGMEGFNNLKTFNNAIADLNKNGFVELSMKDNNNNITTCTIEETDDQTFILSINNKNFRCLNVNDALVKFREYCENKSQHMNEQYDYNSYVIIDNSDNANLGSYDNVSDAIKDADDYAYRNKYGSYSVVGCVDGEYDLDDTSVIYTADKDNLYESSLTPRERKAEELRRMKVYGERLPEEEIENLLDEFEDDYDYLTQDNLETMYYYDAKDNGLTL